MTARSFSSSSIKLGSFAGALAGTVMLAGCGDDSITKAYPDKDACINDRVFTQEFCDKSYRDAEASHQQKAPVYENQEDCLQDWNKCEDTSPQPSHSAATAHGGGGGVYIVSSHSYQPQMSGYVVNASGSKTTPRATFTESAARTTDGDMRGMASRTTYNNFGYVSRPAPIVSEGIPARPSFVSGTSISRGGFVSGAHGFSIGG
jgi:uncharacterized protein YgiB involved in biofilm formation